MAENKKISDLQASGDLTGGEKIPVEINSGNLYITPLQISEYVAVPDLSNVLNGEQILAENLATATDLGGVGASNTKVPSQLAVKTYVDTKSSASKQETLTNKTIDANGTGNTISNIETADFAAGVVDDTITLGTSTTKLATQHAIKHYVDSIYDNAVTNDQIRYCGIITRPTIEYQLKDGEIYYVYNMTGTASWNYEYQGKILRGTAVNELDFIEIGTQYVVAYGPQTYITSDFGIVDYKYCIPIYTLVGGEITKTWDTLVTDIRPENLRIDSLLMKEILQEPTGFDHPENVIVTYDSSEKKITLSGTWNAYCGGKLSSIITTGYISEAHGSTLDKFYWLYADCDGAHWSETFPGFNNILIATIYYRTNDKFALRECHGLMQWQTHESEHYTIGCFKKSGGTISGVTLLSNTGAERRPDVASCVIQDEDLPTTNASLTSKKYSVRYLSSTDTIEYDIEASDILRLNGSVPYYNPWNGSAFVQTAMPANSLMTVWLYEVPVTADADSQQYRHVFVQGQSITQAANSSSGALTTAYNTELSKSTLDLNLGAPSILAAEYVAVGKLIIQYTSNDWSIRDISTVSGTKALQVGSPTGSFLNSVSTDTTITGTGTISDPLTVVQNYIPKTTNITSLNETGIADGEICVFNPTNKDIRTSDYTVTSILSTASSYAQGYASAKYAGVITFPTGVHYAQYADNTYFYIDGTIVYNVFSGVDCYRKSYTCPTTSTTHDDTHLYMVGRIDGVFLVDDFSSVDFLTVIPIGTHNGSNFTPYSGIEMSEMQPELHRIELDTKLAKTANVTAIDETGIADNEICIFNKTAKTIATSNVLSTDLCTAASSNTFTNKTIDANGTGNSISNLETADFAANVIDTDHAMVADSDTRIPSQNAVKAYIDGLDAYKYIKCPTDYNSFFGNLAGDAAHTGYSEWKNTGIGGYSLHNVHSSEANEAGNNTAIGFASLMYTVIGNNNVAIGSYAGAYETGSNKFFVNSIDRGTSANDISKSLLYGTFNDTAANQTLRINAVPSIMGEYTLPVDNGTSGQFLTTNGSSAASWETIYQVPTGGTTGQVLAKVNNDNFNYGWADAATGAGGGTTTLPTQRVWTDAFTITYSSATAGTVECASSAIATVVANSLIGKLCRWFDDNGTTVKRGFVTQATASGTTVTINLAGDPLANDDTLTSFRVSMYETVKYLDWYIPGQQVVDASNSVGKIYFNRTLQDYRILSCSAYLGTAGVHSGTGVFTYNIYSGANAIFGTAPDMVELAVLDNSVPSQNNPIAGGTKITLRTTAITADTTVPQDFYLIAFYAYDDLWDSI